MASACLQKLLVVTLVVLASTLVNGKKKGYSWVVRIEENGKFVCGGILIGRQKILTVLGCINKRNLPDYRLVFGYRNDDVTTNEIKKVKESKDGVLLFIIPKGKVDVPNDDISRLPRIANEAKLEKVVGKSCVLTGFDNSDEPSVQPVNVLKSKECSAKEEKELCFVAEELSKCVAKKGTAVHCYINRRWTLVGLLGEESCGGKYQTAISIYDYKREIERGTKENQDSGSSGEGVPDCEDGEIVCTDMETCARLCDGEATCDDGIDELYCAPDCLEGELICSDKQTCATFCNNITECPGGEDESGCASDCPQGEFICDDKQTCATFCNNITECTGGEDESSCDSYQICEYCTRVAIRCNGEYECYGCETQMDEDDCDTFPFVCPYDQVLCDDRSGCATLCDCKEECTKPKDEVACPCESGYGTSWLLISGYSLTITVLVDDFPGTLDECKAECRNTTNCLSFQYYLSENKCDLFAAGAYGNEGDLFDNGIFDFYQRRCLECEL